MTVADLKQLLDSMSTWLANLGGKKISAELDRLAQSLESHQGKTIAEFCDFLVAAGAGDGRESQRKADKAKTRPADPEKVRVAVEGLRSLFDRAVEPDLSYETINNEIERLDRELNKDEGLDVAKEFGISSNVKSKIAALQEVGRRIADRKTIHDRAKRIENPELLTEPDSEQSDRQQPVSSPQGEAGP